MPVTERPLLVCLLPARNAEADLDGYFAAIAGVCDAVIALDDGSTDETAAALERHPLVKILLRNPRRDDYRGWDDAANRNRLLDAAAALNPEWIISLDADERLDAIDARSLRQFLSTDALPGCAYGFRHVHMRRDRELFWPRYQWIYRLFSYGPGQRFPSQRLHFIPIPTSIPQQHWIETTLRIQHLGGSTDDRRLLRFSKYLEADPTRRYQTDYSNVLQGPLLHDLRRWQSRPAGMPVLLAEATSPQVELVSLPGQPVPPVLSAIIIARNDEAVIERAVRAAVSQQCPEPFEVIVVTSGGDRTAEIVRREFPAVQVVELDHPALPGEARNAGLAVANGMFITFPGSHIELPAGSLAARLRAHRRGYAMVTDITLNGNTTAAGWASYFLDQHEGLPGHQLAELNGPPGHCSYARLPLIEVGGFAEDVRTGEDTAVNRALVRRGYVAVRDPAVRIIHRSPCRTLPHLLRHHYRRGKGWGRLLLEDSFERGHVLNRASLREHFVEHVPTRLARIASNVQRAEPALVAEYERVRLPIVLGAIASWAGMWAEILKPSPGKMALLFDRPDRTILLIGDGPDPLVMLMKIGLISGAVSCRALPSDLPIPAASGELVALSSLMASERAAHSVEELRDSIAKGIHVRGLDVIRGDREFFADWEEAYARKSQNAQLGSLVRVYAQLLRGQIRTTLPVWMLGQIWRAVARDQG